MSIFKTFFLLMTYILSVHHQFFLTFKFFSGYLGYFQNKKKLVEKKFWLKKLSLFMDSENINGHNSKNKGPMEKS